MSLASKLARLPPLERTEATTASPPASPSAHAPTSEARPTLEELRDRIARLIARDASREPPAPARRREREAVELPFITEETPLGSLDRAVRPSPPGHRVGSVPLWSARTADPALLALLALDPALAGCSPERALYVDTETTGLSGGAGTVPFLIGLGFFSPDHGGFVVEQLLLRDLGREAPMLEHVRARLEAASMVVTFNGKAFDLPLLKTRTVLCRTPSLPARPHLDLLHVARRLHRHRVASCSLVHLEDAILGRERVGDVAGADIAAIYGHYLRSGDEDALAPVVEHNLLDVVSMVALVGLYGEPLEAWVSPPDAGVRRAPGLVATDLAAAAKVVKRAGDLDRALAFAESSVRAGAGAFGRRVRGDLLKARGEKAAALVEYEEALALYAPADEADAKESAALRLELAKLYEHHARAYDRALAVAAQGTPERDDRAATRIERLERKLRAPPVRRRRGDEAGSPRGGREKKARGVA